MDFGFSIFSLTDLALCLCVAFGAGLIKGVVGFGMPMIMISGLSSIISPELALAGLLLPTLMSNGLQALRQGWREAWKSTLKFRRYLIAGGITLLLSAQLVNVISLNALLLIIGIPLVFFSSVQLLGWRAELARQTPRMETGIGVLAGFLGGLSGIWGPPTVMYLTALNTEKTEQVRVQGVIYGLGAVALVGAHMASGLLSAQTA
ncbi:MAG: sulfite exporter TauE/SafE family protein, partial [Rhodobacteraceae bacterium]|nr:sulfite exporter TauE/SafE family protein [Paracoccaceae bacterium]